MSWLNNSLNTIKGQLTTLANEVLAETAGPGDEQYRGENIEERNTIELLAETQKDKEQLHQLCEEQELEIVNLRKQIEELQHKISNRVVNVGGRVGAGDVAAANTEGNNSDPTSKSPSDNNNPLEDSWCWELENPKNDNENSSETSSGNGNEMVNITLEEVSLGATKTSRRKQGFANEGNYELQKRLQDLENENKQLNVALEALDSDHNEAMQNVLETKTQLQEKLATLTANYETLKAEQAEKFISSELEMARIKKQCDLLQQKQQMAEAEKCEFEKKVANYEQELKCGIEEMADLQAMLEKKSQDNVELVERVQAVKQEAEQAAEERNALTQQIEELLKEVESLKANKEKKTSESSSSCNSKQSEDEFIVVREGEVSSTSTTPPSKEKLKDKIVQLENRVSELTLENGSLNLKLQNCEMEKQLTADVFKENLQEMQQSSDKQQQAILTLNEQITELQEKMLTYKDKAAESVMLQKQLDVLNKEKEDIASKLDNLKELEKRLLMSEQEKETLQLELQGMRLAQERVTELESKMQQLTIQHQQLQLNAEAETETSLNNNEELEEKLKKLSEENEAMRIELEHMAHEKFRQAIAEEKQEITDLDAEEDEPFTLQKLRELLEVAVAPELNEEPQELLEKSYKALSERLARITTLEQNLTQMSEQLIDLQNSKLVWNHEKKTLEADISQYILQCDELMKNNEILLNELENYKRNKLETISEHNEENILQLEQQLEECQKLNKSLEAEYAEQQEHLAQLQLEKQEMAKNLQDIELEKQQLLEQQAAHLLQLQNLELQNDKTECELNVLLSERNEEHATNAEALIAANEQVTNLEQQLTLLSKDHADLVAAMNAQKQTLLEANKARDEQEHILSKQLNQIAALEEKLQNNNDSELTIANELQTELQSKNVLFEQLEKELRTLQKQLNALQTERVTVREQLAETRQTLEATQQELEAKQTQLLNLEATNAALLEQINFYANGAEDITNLQEQIETLHAELNELHLLSAKQNSELELIKESTKTDAAAIEKIAKLESQLLPNSSDTQQAIDALNAEKQEMLQALQQKHAENLQYYAEIQRLQNLTQQLQQQLSESLAAANATQQCQQCLTLQANISDLTKEQEKLRDQINFLKEKSDILTTNLLTEQTNQKLVRQEKTDVEEQNSVLRKDLERLRQHLLEIEELHTQETVELQTELEKTNARMLELENEVSKSSNAYTSASIRANQHAETLQAQYALLVQQRDELVAKLSSAEDRESKNQAALCNLQCALEQFQNDKENDIKAATLRIRKELQLELNKQKQLQMEITAVQQQLTEANQGLAAASRLSDQLEASQQAIAALREEVDTLKQQNAALEQQLNSNETSQADKIDKNLIKSLLIGYVVSSSANDKQQVLRMISSVLDFTQSETDKVGLNKQQSSWLGSLLGVADTQGNQNKDNLVQAFVQFLEQESQPKVNDMPNLLNITHSNDSGNIATTNTTTTAAQDANTTATSSNPSDSSQNAHSPLPIQLNLNEFAPSRNSSSILKDILNDS